MIRKHGERAEERKLHIRGGEGAGRSVELLSNGEMSGVLSLGRTTLEPGASIGDHAHPNTEDLYLILEGHGTGILDGERFPVSVGDLFLVKAGGNHGLINDSDGPLTFLGVLTRSPGNNP